MKCVNMQVQDSKRFGTEQTAAHTDNKYTYITPERYALGPFVILPSLGFLPFPHPSLAHSQAAGVMIGNHYRLVCIFQNFI